MLPTLLPRVTQTAKPLRLKLSIFNAHHIIDVEQRSAVGI